MKICIFIIGAFSLVSCFCTGAFAVRPPIKPLGTENLQKLVADAEVIAVGTVSSVTRTKTPQPPRRETINIRAVVSVDRIFKGEKSMKTITIEESYQQFSSKDSRDENITALTAGPSPPVGTYRQGERVLLFLKSMNASGVFRPLGSGNHDAYLGLLLITSNGVKSDKYMFDETISKYAVNEESFFSLIASLIHP